MMSIIASAPVTIRTVSFLTREEISDAARRRQIEEAGEQQREDNDISGLTDCSEQQRRDYSRDHHCIAKILACYT